MMTSNGLGYEELKRRIASYRSEAAAQKARRDQAQVQVVDCEKRIQLDFKVASAQLEPELQKTTQEINRLTNHICQTLEQANV